ncbi:MAG: hypothetical protein N3A69_02425 [Leptospiraceae bacterium]|nr:hypothetical protein [Leptospiraceae bacterium]
MPYISPIAIDMGAKNTGVYFTHYPQGEEPLSTQGKTFSLQVGEKTYILSLKNRLANRHRMRAQKRRKLAKRLFFLILKEKYGLREEKTPVWDFIRGLLNRRGFTFLTEEQEASKDDTPPRVDWEIARYFFPDEFENAPEQVEENALEYLKFLASEDLNKAKSLWDKLRNINLKDNQLQTKIKEMVKDESYTKKEIEESLKALKNLAGNLYNQITLGHKYRTNYFEEIQKDITNAYNENIFEFKSLLDKAKLKPEKFHKLLAHISNLQLRVLRKYFNDEKMKKADYWNEERLQKFFLRYVKGWHAKTENDKENKKKILKYFQNNNAKVLDFFLNEDPEATIPPYEDQNNRSPVHCQSLLLDATKMDKQFAGWREITHKLSRDGNNKILDFYDEENIEDVLDSLKKSLAGLHQEKKIPFDKDSILLQRILETTAEASIYRPRLLVKLYPEKKKESSKEENK